MAFLARHKYGVARCRRVVKNKSIPIKKPVKFPTKQEVKTNPALDIIFTSFDPLLITPESARVK
jgi:hypothetical protein